MKDHEGLKLMRDGCILYLAGIVYISVEMWRKF